jgi:hypothetical protein
MEKCMKRIFKLGNRENKQKKASSKNDEAFF